MATVTREAAINHVQQRPEGIETRSRWPRWIAALSRNGRRKTPAHEATPMVMSESELGIMHPDLSNGGDVS